MSLLTKLHRFAEVNYILIFKEIPKIMKYILIYVKQLGQLCENRIDMCSYNPCVPASTCEVIPQGGFSCVCHEGDSCHKCKLNY